MKNNQNKTVALQQKNAFSGSAIVIDSKLSPFGIKRITKMTHPIIEALRGKEAQFTELRRYFHQHPEIGWEEQNYSVTPVLKMAISR